MTNEMFKIPSKNALQLCIRIVYHIKFTSTVNSKYMNFAFARLDMQQAEIFLKVLEVSG